MNTSSSSIRAEVLRVQSVTITPNSAASVAEMLDVAEMLECFATRLLDAFLTKKHLQALAR